MRALHRTRLRALFGAIAIGCAGLTLIGWLLRPDPAAASAQALHDAERRWAQRTFGSYHLHLTDKRCAQRIDVRNERVVKVAPNRCDAPPRAVSDLFALIRRSGQVTHACIYQGCACNDIMRVDATYHAELGYPDRIIVRMRAEPNWRHPDFWERLVTTQRLPSCDAMVEGSKIIQIVQITPGQ